LTPGAKTCLMGENRVLVTARIAFFGRVIRHCFFLPAWVWRYNWVQAYDFL
jgi:hypothetical protein